MHKRIPYNTIPEYVNIRRIAMLVYFYTYIHQCIQVSMCYSVAYNL